MKNPNGYGTVAKLSGNRRRPFIVKKTVGFKENGQPIYDIIGYTATREEGNILLAQYNSNPWDVDWAKITLGQLFDLWKEKKAPKLSQAHRHALFSAFNHCKVMKNKLYCQIKAFHMQDTIDNCGKSYATQNAIKNLWLHLDKFAFELDIIQKCYSQLLTSESAPPTTRTVFTVDEVKTIWEHQNEPWVDTVLIFLYSGWRISELLALKSEDVDLEAGTMKGGTKTKAGKNRIVPIHSRIRPFVENRLMQGGERLISLNKRAVPLKLYRSCWKEIMTRLNMSHIPHECRHTFETRLDSAGANRRCIDLLMGHVSKDTGNRIYNHKTLEELRATIELITV